MIDKTIYKNVSLFRKNDTPLSELKNTKNQSHNISISDDKYENKKIVGGVWLKETDKGAFYSGKLDNGYERKDGTKVDEYIIISRSYLNELLKKDNTDNTEKELNVDDIPF